MNVNDILPIMAGIAFLGVTVYISRGSINDKTWIFAAALSVLFLIFSAFAAITEGPTGFWPEHTRNNWGNQIWFDLVLAVGVGWLLLVPRAKNVGMQTLPWLALIAATGSIGLLAMLARVLYLESRTAA